MPTDSTYLEIDAPTSQPSSAIRRVPLDAPWDWLARGWRDLCAVPLLSISYGALFCIAGWMAFYGLNEFELSSLIGVLAGGFVLVAPLLAAGFYEVSRRLEAGETVAVRAVARACAAASGRLALFGIVLFFAYFAWVELSFLMLALFLDGAEVPEASIFVHRLIFTNAGVALLVTSVVMGGMLAAMVFTLASIAAPLMLVKDVDAVSAMATSVRIVKENWGPMTLWAAIIAGYMALGLATMFVGLAVIFPLLGHATWHAYRDLIAGQTPACGGSR
jgi:uncharacterized membrane protein